MDDKITTFKESLQEGDIVKYKIVIALEDLFLTYKDVKERFIYGGIGMYIQDKLIGGIWVNKNHVSLIFSDGYLLDNKYGQLEGKGKYRRHIKVQEVSDVEKKHCKEYIDQLVEMDT